MTTTKHLEIDARKQPVKSVTVYKSGKADVSRAFSVDLEVGENTIVVSHLSNSLQKQSVRVSGMGGAARLSDIVTTIGSAGDGDTNDSVILQQVLERNSKHLVAQQGVLVEELQILRSYAKSMEHTNVPVEEMFKFLEVFREKQMSTLSTILEFEKPIGEAHRALENAKKEAKVNKGIAESKVAIQLHAEQACKITLRLRYVVHDATWKPVYDLHASLDDPKSVKISYRAKVTQSTGEDWSDAELTLSSASALTNMTVPTLPTYKISSNAFFTTSVPQQPPRSLFTRTSTSGGLFVPPVGSGLFGAPTAAPSTSLFGSTSTQPQPQSEAPAPTQSLFGQTTTNQSQPNQAIGATNPATAVALTESTATIRTNSISETYAVQGTVNVPSDGEEHVVSITSFDVEADITRVSVPRLKADVYLQCKVKNASAYRLLAGIVRVFLDDSYVSTASISDIEANETFECTLGADPSIGVSYERTTKTTTGEARRFGGFESSVTTYTTRMVIKNKRSTPVNQLIFKDALPLGDDSKDWKVILRQPKGLADAAENEEIEVRDGSKSKRKIRWSSLPNGKGGETEGKYEWILDIPAGEETTLLAEWDVKALKGEFWIERAEATFGSNAS